MEGKVCMYNKFDFCKFKDTCRKQHFRQIFEDLSCKEIKNCQKRHPKVCKRFAAHNECRFGIDCSYKHQKSEKYIEQNVLKEKIQEMEKKVEEVALKIEDNELIKKVNLLETVVFFN